ncbi:MAG: exonuclease SbcCD subunit D [Thermoleophilia bacterium]|nr:exonuclease SbcCD subunit D [Thermoleophilia bacterium]MDH3724648.1 exonuclease SbcCD subunit D [Thermoleophilia bacterium]
MRLLHTADWHVGRQIRGRSRADEHRSVLDEISRIAEQREVDVVIVAGDLFETAAPTAESEQIVYSTLLRLATIAQRVVVIAGNHDNPRRLAAVSPLLELGNVIALSEAARPHEGGVQSITLDGGERLNLALLPFVSQRGIVRVEQLMAEDPDQHAQTYAERVARVIASLCAPLEQATGAVNVLAGHLTVSGGLLGGGERSVHTLGAYAVPAGAFSSALHYVALGHLHRTQEMAAPCPSWYCGSPLQLDFGEENDSKHVLVIDAEAGRPAKIDQVPLTEGRRLRTLAGSLGELIPQSDSIGEDWLRVRVHEVARPGLADDVREHFPNAVEVMIERLEDRDTPARPRRIGRQPGELFAEYLELNDIEDPRLIALFAELHEEAGA